MKKLRDAWHIMQRVLEINLLGRCTLWIQRATPLSCTVKPHSCLLSLFGPMSGLMEFRVPCPTEEETSLGLFSSELDAAKAPADQKPHGLEASVIATKIFFQPLPFRRSRIPDWLPVAGIRLRHDLPEGRPAWIIPYRNSRLCLSMVGCFQGNGFHVNHGPAAVLEYISYYDDDFRHIPQKQHTLLLRPCGQEASQGAQAAVNNPKKKYSAEDIARHPACLDPKSRTPNLVLTRC